MDGDGGEPDGPLTAGGKRTKGTTIVTVELTWIAPAVVVTAGAAGIAALIRRLDAAAADLAASARRLRHVEDALIPVRVETRRTRASLDRYDRR